MRKISAVALKVQNRPNLVVGQPVPALGAHKPSCFWQGRKRAIQERMNASGEKPNSTLASQVDLRCFAIVLVPVVIVATHKFISQHLMPGDLKVSDDILKDGQNWLEAAGRYRFLAAAWFFGALSVLSAALLCRALMRPMTSATRTAAIATFLFVLALAALPTLKGFGNTDGSQVYDGLGKAIYEGVMSRGTLKGCAGPEDTWLMGDCGVAPVVNMFSSVVDLVNIFAGLALGSLIVGMILSLDIRTGENVEEAASRLADNLRHMRQQLYLSGLVLSSGMLYATSWIYWPLPLIEDSESAAYGSLLLSAALYTGTYFSLLILSFYLPVAFVLDARVKSLANRAEAENLTGEPPETEEWCSARGLTEGLVEHLRAGLALASPIFAAFAGGISPISL